MNELNLSEEERLEIAIEALKFYAAGGAAKIKNGLNEFGCGCCAGYTGDDGCRDYDKDGGQDVQGLTARATLSKITLS